MSLLNQSLQSIQEAYLKELLLTVVRGLGGTVAKVSMGLNIGAVRFKIVDTDLPYDWMVLNISLGRDPEILLTGWHPPFVAGGKPSQAHARWPGLSTATIGTRAAEDLISKIRDLSWANRQTASRLASILAEEGLIKG